MVSIAVVPASSLNFLTSFAYADSQTRASQVTLTSKPLSDVSGSNARWEISQTAHAHLNRRGNAPNLNSTLPLAAEFARRRRKFGGKWFVNYPLASQTCGSGS